MQDLNLRLGKLDLIFNINLIKSKLLKQLQNMILKIKKYSLKIRFYYGVKYLHNCEGLKHLPHRL